MLSLLAAPRAVTSLTKTLNSARGSERGARKVAGPQVRASCEALVAEHRLIRIEASNHYEYFAEGPIAVAVLEKLHAAHTLNATVERVSASHGDSAFPWRTAGLAWPSRLRVALAKADPHEVAHVLELARRDEPSKREISNGVIEAAGVELSPLLVEAAPADICDAVLATCFLIGEYALVALPPHVLEASARCTPKVRKEAAQYLALRGHDKQARALVGSNAEGLATVAVVTAFLAGDWRQAATVGLDFCSGLKRKNKALGGAAGVLHVLACFALSTADPRALPHAEDAIESALARSHTHADCYSPMLGLVAPRLHYRPAPPESALAQYVTALCVYWQSQQAPASTAEVLPPPPQWERWADIARRGGFKALAGCMDTLVAAFADPEHASGLPAAFTPRKKWERALDRLELAVTTVSGGCTVPHADKPPDKPTLLWELELMEGDVTLRPRIRKTARARKGAVLSPNTLVSRSEQGKVDLTDQDRLVMAGLITQYDQWSARPHRAFGPRAVLGLVGHPRVIDASGAPVTVVAGAPTLVLESTGRGGARLVARPRRLAHAEVAMQNDGPGHYTVYRRPEAWQTVLDGVPPSGLEVPSTGVARLKALLVELNVVTPVDAVGISFGDKQVAAQGPLLVRLIWDGIRLGSQSEPHRLERPARTSQWRLGHRTLCIGPTAKCAPRSETSTTSASA